MKIVLGRVNTNLFDIFRLLRELLKSRQEVNQLLHQSVDEQQLLLENAQLTAAQRSEVGKTPLQISVD